MNLGAPASRRPVKFAAQLAGSPGRFMERKDPIREKGPENLAVARLPLRHEWGRLASGERNPSKARAE